MHDIAYVQVEYPVVLVFNTQNCLNVVLKLDISTLAFGYSMRIVHLAPGIVVGRHIGAVFPLLEHLFGRGFVSDCSSSIDLIGVWAGDSSKVIVFQVFVREASHAVYVGC